MSRILEEPDSRVAATGLDEQRVDAVVRLAARAPSAENTQPWRITREGDRLVVAHDRAHQMPSDPGGMLDYTGLGALVESLVLAASGRGWSAEVDLAKAHAPAGDFPVVAKVRLRDAEAQHADADPLAAELANRCTTRRMDPKRRLADDALHAVEAAAAQPGVRIDWIIGQALERVAKLVGEATRLRFEHQAYHQEFYANLRFTREEAEQSRDGLPIGNLQLPFGVASVMRFFRKWPRARLGNALGYSRAVGSHATKEVLGSGAVGVLSVDNAERLDFLRGGRAFQRAWLEATRCELAFHPVAGLTVFIGHGEWHASSTAPDWVRKRARGLSRGFRTACPELNGRVPQMMFRLGYGEPPEVKTLRTAPTSGRGPDRPASSS